MFNKRGLVFCMGVSPYLIHISAKKLIFRTKMHTHKYRGNYGERNATLFRDLGHQTYLAEQSPVSCEIHSLIRSIPSWCTSDRPNSGIISSGSLDCMR